MKAITAHLRILDEKNKPVSGKTLNLETFLLKTGRWQRIGSGKSKTDGNWSVSVRRSAPNEMHAPMLRVVEPPESGQLTPRVVAQHAYMKYDKQTGTLTVDFGVVELLNKETFKLSPSTTQFSRNRHFIAGQAEPPVQIRPQLVARMNLAPGVSRRVVAAGDQRSERNEAELHTLRSSQTLLKQNITDKEKELKQANLRIADLSTLLQARGEELEHLKEQAGKKQPVEVKPTPISTIATNIGTEVDSANNNLKIKNLPYRFGKIDVKLKGSVAQDGQSIALTKPGDNVQEHVLSHVNLELLHFTDPTDLNDRVTVPDVKGLTETVVRRLLNGVGLRLEAVSKSIGGQEKIPIGQSIQQSPKAGAGAARNDTVLVVFAAP